MSDRGNFEKEWSAAFESAEEQPKPGVWSEVKAELAALEADNQRKKAVYWRWVGVAASVAMLMMAGVFTYRSIFVGAETNSNENNEIAQVLTDGETSSLPSESENGVVANNENSPELEQDKTNMIAQDASTTKPSALSSNAPKNTSSETNAGKENTDKSVQQNGIASVETGASTQNRVTSGFVTNEADIVPLLSENEAFMDPIERISALMPIDSIGTLAELNTDFYMQKVPDLEELFKHKKKNDYSNMWAGLSLGGGSFNPNVGSSSGGLLFGNSQNNVESDPGSLDSEQAYNIKNSIDNNEASESADFSYNFSVDFGKQLSRRLLIESGVEYAKYASQATSNLTSNKNQQSEAFLRNTSADFSYADLQNTSTYELQNSFEYVSVPVSLGYVVVDRKVGVMLSSGVSADVFLSNTLEDKSGTYESVVQKNTSDSPYRPVNINGLLGGEIYYRWNDNYVLAIDPGYRFSLTGITKSDANFSSRPTSFFIGFKFKYLL